MSAATRTVEGPEVLDKVTPLGVRTVVVELGRHRPAAFVLIPHLRPQRVDTVVGVFNPTLRGRAD
jgi:hypothetical protein